MTQEQSGRFPIHTMSDRVRALDKVCRELSSVMTEQLKAVVTSDAERVMQLTERNAEVQLDFQEAEQAFINEMQNLAFRPAKDEGPVTLERLKQMYPGYGGFIDDWKKQITANLDKLQKQQEQLVQLIEFAQQQNSDLMRSVYHARNGKNVHYHHNGRTSDVQSGIAVNQKG
ncbi:flagellar export chaperone FlgN [Balneolales bacterium ANBcel1]|nr:flagellar export chaperone FlgN [Balneolales bacterium ANBcel1]